jgi:hypothetical protein
MNTNVSILGRFMKMHAPNYGTLLESSKNVYFSFNALSEKKNYLFLLVIFYSIKHIAHFQ